MQKARIAKTKSALSLLFGSLAVLVLAAILFANRPKDCTGGYREDATVMIDSYAVISERADTNETRQTGLSNRACIPEHTGMLFVFDQSNLHGIWMKDMNFAIDVLWLDSSKKVVHLEKYMSPDSYPVVYYPKDPASYVLELRAGSVDGENIAVGQQLSW